MRTMYLFTVQGLNLAFLWLILFQTSASSTKNIPPSKQRQSPSILSCKHPGPGIIRNLGEWWEMWGMYQYTMDDGNDGIYQYTFCTRSEVERVHSNAKKRPRWIHAHPPSHGICCHCEYGYPSLDFSTYLGRCVSSFIHPRSLLTKMPWTVCP